LIIGVPAPLREPGRDVWALAGLPQSQVVAALFSCIKAGRWEIHANQRALLDPGLWLRRSKTPGCAWDPATVPGFCKNNACAASRSTLGPRHRADATCRHVLIPGDEGYTTVDGLFSLRRRLGLNFAGFSNRSNGIRLACCRGNCWQARSAACPEAAVDLVEMPRQKISHFRVSSQPGGLGVQPLGPRRGSAGAFGRPRILCYGLARGEPCLIRSAVQ